MNSRTNSPPKLARHAYKMNKCSSSCNACILPISGLQLQNISLLPGPSEQTTPAAGIFCEAKSQANLEWLILSLHKKSSSVPWSFLEKYPVGFCRLLSISLSLTAQSSFCLSQIMCYCRNLKCLTSCLPEMGFFFPEKNYQASGGWNSRCRNSHELFGWITVVFYQLVVESSKRDKQYKGWGDFFFFFLPDSSFSHHSLSPPSVEWKL